jgi:hypothetical protein
VPGTSEGSQLPPPNGELEEPLPESFNRTKSGWKSIGPSKARKISSGERKWKLKRESKIKRMK